MLRDAVGPQFNFPSFYLHGVLLGFNMRAVRIGVDFRELCAEEENLRGIEDPEQESD